MAPATSWKKCPGLFLASYDPPLLSMAWLKNTRCSPESHGDLHFLQLYTDLLRAARKCLSSALIVNLKLVFYPLKIRPLVLVKLARVATWKITALGSLLNIPNISFLSSQKEQNHNRKKQLKKVILWQSQSYICWANQQIFVCMRTSFSSIFWITVSIWNVLWMQNIVLKCHLSVFFAVHGPFKLFFQTFWYTYLIVSEIVARWMDSMDTMNCLFFTLLYRSPTQEDYKKSVLLGCFCANGAQNKIIMDNLEPKIGFFNLMFLFCFIFLSSRVFFVFRIFFPDQFRAVAPFQRVCSLFSTVFVLIKREK